MTSSTSDPSIPTREGYQDLREYIGLSETDNVLLRSFHAQVQPKLKGVVDNFYVRVQDFPGAMAVLSSPSQIARLKATLSTWLDELLLGPWNARYCERRVRIGVRHVQVGLQSQYMFGAMSVVRDNLYALARDLAPERSDELCTAITRITEFDLALMTMTYMEVINTAGQRTIQDLILKSLPVSVLCLDSDLCVTASTQFFESQTAGSSVHEALPADLLNALDIRTAIEDAHREQTSSVHPDISTPEGRHYRLTVVPVEHALATTIIHLEDTSAVLEAETRANHYKNIA